MKKYPNLILAGIQGSGKWTQSRKIIEKFGYKLFDTGAELRKISETDSPLWKSIKNIIESGKYVPSEYIRDTISNFIENNKNFSIIFDSPIRSQEQDKVIRPILGNCIVICLDLDREIAINRLLHRKIDPETGEIFGQDFVWDINPKTWNKLIIRKDDNIEAITNRIEWSINETLPLVEVWKENGYQVFHLDANRDIEDIFDDISNIISSF